ncbi:MAG TPA: amidohydrolase [Planctomycetaceae bacterium]|jgi:predicted TIM-barrel fold metal-dependent hydrolase|nr:amidohydrolase [Planctomycetaceae bacterium]HCK52661.1 amidohydrolase [Planctomycetaceae bacterium]|tara:strand:+ start:2599 stop:3429 length:831 start_codon:yes stop_codon:yes gene_type:complete
MKFIDAHSHIWTPDTKAYPLGPGYRRFNMKPPSFTVAELQENMKGVGVNRVVLIQMSFYGFDNSYMLDSIRQHPKAFSGVAVIDQDQPRVDLEMRKMKGQGVRGFRIYPKNQKVEQWLDNPAMHAMWKTAADEDLAMCCLIDPDALPAIDRMCRRYPKTTVVIDHFSRIGESGEIKPADVKALTDLARHKNVYVKISAYYALGKKKPPYQDLGPMIKQMLDAYGRKRLMWASDAPFQVVDGHTYKASIDLIKSGLDFLDDDDRDWLLRKTAERVFF